jgi:hypothetical protein
MTQGQEIARLGDPDIQSKTARQWAARAAACYARAARAKTAHERARWCNRATSYRDEALEHAALVGDHGRSVARIQRAIDKVRGRAQGRGRK